MARQSTLQRWWAKVEVTDTCWLWRGARSRTGYGNFWDGARYIDAHRFAFEQFVAPIPAGHCVCHRCDVRECCCPHHMFLGSHLDNMADMVAKARSLRGEANPGSKLTYGEVVLIKRMLRERWATQQVIASHFGVNQTAISLIAREKTWWYVPWPREEQAA